MISVPHFRILVETFVIGVREFLRGIGEILFAGGVVLSELSYSPMSTSPRMGVQRPGPYLQICRDISHR